VCVRVCARLCVLCKICLHAGASACVCVCACVLYATQGVDEHAYTSVCVCVCLRVFMCVKWRMCQENMHRACAVYE
jgi:hypothetical protein